MPTRDDGDDACTTGDVTGDAGQTDAVEVPDRVDDAEWVQIHQAHYDRESGDDLPTALAFAVADARGVDPLDRTAMSPLYDAVDAEALEETFFGPSGAGTDREEEGVVTFTYGGHKVALQSDGWIFVYGER